MKHVFVVCFVLLASCAALELPSPSDASLGPSQNYDSLGSLGISENYPPGESSQNGVYMGSSENYAPLGLFENYLSGESSQIDAVLASSQNDASLGFYENYHLKWLAQDDASVEPSQNDAFLESSENHANPGFYENYPTIRLSQGDTSLKPSRFDASPSSFRRNMLIVPINIVNILIRNLQKGAQDILNIVHVISNDIIKEGNKIRKNITSQMQDLGKQIMERLLKIPRTLSGISASVKKCYHAAKADVMLQVTADPLSCVGEEIEKVGDQLQELKRLAADAIAGAAATIEDVQYCERKSPNRLLMGVCLGETVLQAQMRSVAFLSESALSIARTNVIITSIPTRIAVCVGCQIAEYSSVLVGAVLDMNECFSNEFVGILASKR